MSKTETRPTARKGIKLYKDYFDNEFEDLTATEIGMLIVSLYEYDEYNECNRYKEEIESDRTLKKIYKRLCTNNDRAVVNWELKRKAREEARARKLAELEAIRKAELEAIRKAELEAKTTNQTTTITTTTTETKSEEPNLMEYTIKDINFSFDMSVNNIAFIPPKPQMLKIAEDLENKYDEETTKQLLERAYEAALNDKCNKKFILYINQAEDEMNYPVEEIEEWEPNV